MTTTSFDRTKHSKGLQLRSLVKSDGELELSLASLDVPKPGPNEVLVRVDASPLNPSDLHLLFAAADLETMKSSGTADRPRITATIPERAMKGLSARVGASMPVGNEGAGLVVEAGSDPKAAALLGKTVAVLGGAMYSEYRCVPVEQCLLLPDDATAVDGASAFINPLTALGMVETMRAEGHKALVHTAAASSLGQMLQRICLKDGIPLVNVVRKDEQVELLRGIGAKHVCNTSSPTFAADLESLLSETGATIAFDAIGGGTLASQILSGMEAAISRSAKTYNRYGSSVHKQVYIYGALDVRPTELSRNFGLAWGLGGWLLTPFLEKIGAPAAEKLKQRVAAELKTTFATSYAKEVSLIELLDPKEIAIYAKRTTGGKYLVVPSKR